jgi:hypothetical protein
VKFALTDFAKFIVTVQVGALPVQAPVQPVKDAPGAGVAVNVIAEFAGRVALHPAAPLPQLIPPPLTVPLPVTETERSTDVPPPPPVVNDAVTDLAAVICTVQVGIVPLHDPAQPEKVAPVAGVAVSVTVAFTAGVAVQVVEPLPQLIPGPVTVPAPETETVSRKPAPPAMPPTKVAVTLFDWFISTVQVVPDPPQAPVQPVKVAPVATEAIRVTVAFWAKFAEQMMPPLPQLIVPTPPLTLPLPLTLTLRVTGAATKVALTVRSASIVNVHVPAVPAQAPLHALSTKPSFGLAFSSIVDPDGSNFVQVAGPVQSIPPPSTVPSPEIVNVSSCWSVATCHVAPRSWSFVISTVHDTFVPSQGPLHPLKT